MNELDQTPIVVFGDDWGRHVSTLQHIFRPIMMRRPVVWVNAIGHRKPTLRLRDLKRAWEKGRGMFRRGRSGAALNDSASHGPATVLSPAVLPWHDWAPAGLFNRRSLVLAIRHSLDQLGLTSPPLVVTGSPPSVAAIGHLGERASIYFCMDDFLHLPGVSTGMMAHLEPRLLEKVDAVIATARALVRSKVPSSGVVHYLPQGVNYDHFATPRPEPPDLANVPRPRIGFAGGISACCDLGLVRSLTVAFPTASLVLVGPVSVDLTELDSPNIHVLGPRNYRDLPAYVQSFDVGVIPYVRNRWTDAVDPLKLLEYLAAGIPVVSTAIPEARKYDDVIAVTDDPNVFVRQVGSALTADRATVRARSQELARQHTWERRAEELLTILRQYESEAEHRGTISRSA